MSLRNPNYVALNSGYTYFVKTSVGYAHNGKRLNLVFKCNFVLSPDHYGLETDPRISCYPGRARYGRADGRRWTRLVGRGWVARAGRWLWRPAGEHSGRSASHRAHRHHGRVGDGSGGRDRLPRARGGADHPQEPEAGHHHRAAGHLWVHVCGGHGAHRLSAAAGDLRSGA